MTRRALITGITGQDGYYLAEQLLEQGYQVHGMVRPGPSPKLGRIKPLADRLSLHEADLTDQQSLVALIEQARPHELYNLAGISFVPESWQSPVTAGDVMGLGVARLLEAVRQVDPEIRFCQAGSSEQFGRVEVEPQNESTPFLPRAPYGAAKAYAHWIVANYRKHHRLFACTAIAFNHESPLRNRRFVTRKITDAVARIKLGQQTHVMLGNLDAMRDWGFAGDFTRAMRLMLQHRRATDFVIATGKKHSVRQLVRWSFEHVGLDYHDHVRVDPAFLRPDDTNTLRGDISKARRELAWEPSVELHELMAMMVDADLERVRKEISGGG